jgi:hypothetical protein
LGFIFFPVDLINLQVHKPASADLLGSQFTIDWREIHLDFSSRTFDTGAHVFLPTGARRVRMRFSVHLCSRARTKCTSFHTGGRAFNPKFAL